MSATPAAEPQAPRVPRHIAIIMDGNGRWAERRGLPRVSGHRDGIDPVREVVRSARERGIETLTLFAFSSENFRRPDDEVRGLMALFLQAIERELGELDDNGVRLRFIGDRAELGETLVAAMHDAEQRTAWNQGLELVIAAAYGGRWDLVQAARQLAIQAAAGRIDPAGIDEVGFARALSTADLPPVDLLIRTGAERRISNFLLWDIAYSELYFSDKLWPEFDRDEFDRALGFYAGRERRFGRTGQQGSGTC